MTLVYTYDDLVYEDISKKEITLKYYQESIKRARDLGYTIDLYSNTSKLEHLVDNFYYIESHFSPLWDSFKFIPLRDRKDTFVLIDGDVILHKELYYNSKCSLAVDTIEKGNWNILYNKTIKTLTQLGVQYCIPEWNGKFYNVLSCGILYFNDVDFRKLYVDRWFKLNKFIVANKNKIDLYAATPVSAQYLLTLLVNTYDKEYHYYSSELGLPNEYYTHYAGKDKLKGFDIYQMNSMI